MSGNLERVLVVGAGCAGSAAAILLARAGVHVDLVEQQSSVSALGSGITLQGNALRVLRELGVLDAVLDAGYSFDTLGLRTPGGDLIAEFPDFKIGGDDLPATHGMARQVLARILTDQAEACGAKLRLATTVVSLAVSDRSVDAALSDGTSARYDLVIGADGLQSAVRGMIGIDTAPEPVGMGIWRIFCERPASITRTDLSYGGACYIAGYCPTGEDSMYAYLVEDAQDRSHTSADEALTIFRGLAANYHGPWDDISALLVDPSRVHYTWFSSHVVDGGWNRGRVVLIGDAAHSCPPTLAQGAAMALEDASVLCELLLAADAIDQSTFDAFSARRLPRAKQVVQNSLQLCSWLLAHDQHADVPGLMAANAAFLTQPA